MTRVAVYREPADTGSMPFRAVAGRTQSMGRTAGEALDALAAQLSRDETDTLVIVRTMGPDRFFGGEERSRLEELMARRGESPDQSAALTAEEQAELEGLIDAELRAATERAVSLGRELGS